MGNKQIRSKKKILEQLETLPIIDYACQKIGIARSTYYRWIQEDSTFKTNALAAEERGRSSINDLAESKIIQKIRDGDMKASTYWLESNHKKYIKPRRPVIFDNSANQPQPILVRFMGENDISYNSYQEYKVAKSKKRG
jgi:hypothetical protein